MARGDSFYFDNFVECADYSCKAAVMLEEILKNYGAGSFDGHIEKIHAIEHTADGLKHRLLEELVRAFITPIERDDIIELSQAIDNVTDSVEDILINMNIAGVTRLREDALPFAQLLTRCCAGMKTLLEEFRNFKKSKKIKEIIIEINHLEEEGDRMYMQAMKTLHRTCPDALEVICWREIYKAFEKVCDACEDVADIVESVVIGNI